MKNKINNNNIKIKIMKKEDLKDYVGETLVSIIRGALYGRRQLKSKWRWQRCEN